MKRSPKLFAVIAFTSAILTIILRRYFHMDSTAIILCVCLIVFPGVFLINLFYNLSYLNKIKKASKLLDEGRAEEYIIVMTNLLKTAKGETLRNGLQTNLSAGYIEAAQYGAAINILEELTKKSRLNLSLKTAVYLNLCTSYLHFEQPEKAIALYHQSHDLFVKYKNSKEYGGNIAILDINIAIQEKKYEQASQMLDIAQEKYSGPRFQKDFAKIANILKAAKTI